MKWVWCCLVTLSCTVGWSAEELRYQLPVGLVRHCKISLAANGESRLGPETKPFSLKGAVSATEEVTKQGPGSLVALEIVWDEAEFEIYGQQGSLAPGIARETLRLDPWGGVQDVRVTGRERAAARGQGFQVDVDQLGLLDLLVELAQWPRFPRRAVETGATWTGAEKSPFPDLEAESNTRTTVTSLQTREHEAVAELRTEVEVKVGVDLGEAGTLSGQVKGATTQTFLCRAGKLQSADGRWQVDLTARQPAAGVGGATAEGDKGAEFGLRGEFVVVVQYED